MAMRPSISSINLKEGLPALADEALVAGVGEEAEVVALVVLAGVLHGRLQRTRGQFFFCKFGLNIFS